MSYCPKCKAEYESRDNICPQCGGKLESKQAEPQASGTDDKEAFLISVNQGFETEMVEGNLRSAGIPYLIKSHGGPAGFSRYDTKYESRGSDFYVPAALLVRAKTSLPPVEGAQEIQDELAAQEEGKGADDSSAAEASDASNSRGTLPEEPPAASPVKRILFIILFMVVVALVVAGVDFIMNIFRAAIGYK